MTDTIDHDADTHDAYNTVAIRHAAALHEIRLARHARNRADGTKRPLDQLVPQRDRTAVGVDIEWRRMGQRPVTPELEARADALGIRFEHLGLTLGTVLHGVDLRDDAEEITAVVRATLNERKVVFFRDQHLSEDEQVAFGRRFGPLDAFPFGAPGDNPYVLQIIHHDQSPGTENGWHTDVTWMEKPSLGSIAQMIQAPPVGGDTLFADSHAAFWGLPDAIRERVTPLWGVNDYRIFVQGREGDPFPEDVRAAIEADIPFGVAHPLVRTHPETGKPALYIHGGFLRHDSLHDPETGEQLDPAESRELVRILLAQHPRPEYQCRFRWEEGSIAFWDNRAVQHYAASDYHPHRRVLRRVTIRGDRPAHQPSSAALDPL